MAHMPSPDRGESLKNEVLSNRIPETKMEEVSPIEETTNDLRDTLSGLLNLKGMMPPETARTTEINSGSDFQKKIDEIKGKTNKEDLLLLQIYRAFVKGKPELHPVLCELAEAILEAFKMPELRNPSDFDDSLSVKLQGLTPELLIQIATEKHRETEKKDEKKIAAEMLGDTHPAKRVKTSGELQGEIESIPEKSEVEKKILKVLTTAVEDAKDAPIFDLASRILTVFYHSENRPKLAQSLQHITSTELHDMANELVAIQKSSSGRLKMEAVQELLKGAQTEAVPKSEAPQRKMPTKATPRPDSKTTSNSKPTNDSRGKEDVSRKFATRNIRAVLDGNHLSTVIKNLVEEKTITPESTSYELLIKTLNRLKELEAVKATSKESNEKTNRTKTALKDFAGKITYTIEKKVKKDKETNEAAKEDQKKDPLEKLSEVLQKMGGLLDLSALVLTMKRTEDVKLIEEEIKIHRSTLPLWSDENSSQLARARSYFEAGEKTLEKIEDEEKSEARALRFKNALVDCCSLIVIGLSKSAEEKASAPIKAIVKNLLEQIEMDAQGLEANKLSDHSTARVQMKKHIAERIIDPEEKARADAALEKTEKMGEKAGLTEANRVEKENANREALEARKAGLFDFENIEKLFEDFE